MLDLATLPTQPPYNFQEGAVLLVDKPLRWTSFDVVNKVRYALKKALHVKEIKVGHAGTLDPLATGLLVLCTGKMTKQIDQIQGLVKEYTGTLRLGETTPSFDAETAVDARFDTAGLQPEQLHAAARTFLGRIAQVPPVFSAIKVDGKPLYKTARKGAAEMPAPEPRWVEIERFELTRVAIPEVDFEVRCSKGTYIRSLAHDLGKSLQNGAYLTALRRTHIGELGIGQAWELEALLAHIQAQANPNP